MKIIDGVEVPTCIDCALNLYSLYYCDAYCGICKCTFPWDAPVCVNFKQQQRGNKL